MAQGRTNAAGGKKFKYGEKVYASKNTISNAKLHGEGAGSFSTGDLTTGFHQDNQTAPLLFFDSVSKKYYYLTFKGSSGVWYLYKYTFDINFKLIKTETFQKPIFHNSYHISADFENLKVYTEEVYYDVKSNNYSIFGLNNVARDENYVYRFYPSARDIKIFSHNNTYVKNITLPVVEGVSINNNSYCFRYDSTDNTIMLLTGGKIYKINLSDGSVLRSGNTELRDIHSFLYYFEDCNCIVLYGSDNGMKLSVVSLDNFASVFSCPFYFRNGTVNKNFVYMHEHTKNYAYVFNAVQFKESGTYFAETIYPGPRKQYQTLSGGFINSFLGLVIDRRLYAPFQNASVNLEQYILWYEK